MNRILNRAEKILEIAAGVATRQGRYRIEDIQLNTAGYAEPGYSMSKSGVIALGNWNDCKEYDSVNRSFSNLDDTPSRVGAIFEKMEIVLEWSDEWVSCEDCGKIVRCSPSSYFWKPSYIIQDECSIFCHECLVNDAEDYLRGLEGNHRKANTIDSINPSNYEYVRIEEFEAGLHPGQDANPKLIAQALENQGVERFLFNIDSTGQFDTNFSVWVHQSESSAFDKAIYSQSIKDGPSRSAALKRGLEDASIKLSKLQEDGIKVAVISGDKADVNLLSHEDFVKGKI